MLSVANVAALLGVSWGAPLDGVWEVVKIKKNETLGDSRLKKRRRGWATNVANVAKTSRRERRGANVAKHRVANGANGAKHRVANGANGANVAKHRVANGANVAKTSRREWRERRGANGANEGKSAVK